MSYSALDVSKYIINYVNARDTEISNLKLQKILYFIQGFSFVFLEGEFFKEEIYAWKHGPVIREVYWQYSKFVANGISNEEDVLEFKTEEKKFLDSIIDELYKLSAWELVNITHEHSTWKNHISDMSIISKREIEDFFLEESNNG